MTTRILAFSGYRAISKRLPLRVLVSLITTGALISCSQEAPSTNSQNALTIPPEVQTSELIPPELQGSDIRPEAGGLNGAVVSEHPLASQAGYEVLRRGGNAMDAAVTMAAMLTVVRPHMNSVGGDAFVLYYDAVTREVSALPEPSAFISQTVKLSSANA